MKRKTNRSTLSMTLYLVISMLFAAGAYAADTVGEPGRSSGKKNPLNNVYFGEQHLHTQNSPDAYAMGTGFGGVAPPGFLLAYYEFENLVRWRGRVSDEELARRIDLLYRHSH